MIAIDTECTGKDLHHSSRPFFVTTANPDGSQLYWEWRVNPETREVDVPDEDIAEIDELLTSADEIVGQNIKFDATALNTLPHVNSFPWEKTHDTLLAAHLLASNRPKDLTTLAMIYLGRNITPLEDALEKVVQECRRYCRQNMPRWKISKDGLDGMPSAKRANSSKDKDTKLWKSDTWLPMCVADHLDYPEDHPYRTVLRDYANEDSAVTFAVWIVMREELHRRGLWEIYEERRKVLPITFEMEKRGVTLNAKRLDEL